MTKKAGPLPIWAWVAIAAALGYVLYRYEKGKSETGVEEGFFPTQGIPVEGEGAGGSGSAGIEAAAQAASEAAENRQIQHEERGEERTEARTGREESFAERAEERREAFEKWAAQFARGGGGTTKKKAGKKPPKKKAGKGSSPAPPNTGKTPGHTQTPSHSAAAHPKERVGKAVALPPRKQKARR